MCVAQERRPPNCVDGRDSLGGAATDGGIIVVSFEAPQTCQKQKEINGLHSSLDLILVLGEENKLKNPSKTARLRHHSRGPTATLQHLYPLLSAVLLLGCEMSDTGGASKASTAVSCSFMGRLDLLTSAVYPHEELRDDSSEG